MRMRSAGGLIILHPRFILAGDIVMASDKKSWAQRSCNPTILRSYICHKRTSMIQRKQTLFLIASVLLFLTTFGFPFGTIGNNEFHNYKVIAADGSAVEGISTYYFSVPLAIASLISAYAVFLFGNRQRQMAVVRISFIFYAISFALMSLYLMSAGKAFKEESLHLGISFFLPFAAFFSNLIALRAIRKDEQLVKSVDRIR